MMELYAVESCPGVRFMPDAIRTLLRFRQRPGRNEAGGILLGRVYADRETVVESVTTPGVLDRAGLRFFDRSRSAAQRAVNRAWASSEGEQIYLGEWHTHAEADPKPSVRDRTMIRNMVAQSEMEIGTLLLVIVGTAGVWVGIDDGSALRQMLPVDREDGL